VDFLNQCLVSIYRSITDIDFEIIVIDNASFDGCEEMLQRQFPQARFIQSEKNLGFAKANNAAFRQSRGKYVLFLNPDTKLIGPVVNIMLDYIQKLPNAGAIGCKLLNADKTVQASCVQAFPTIVNQFIDSNYLRTLCPKSYLWGNAILFSAQIGPGEVEAIAGACVMVRRSLFERVGLFSEDYFMYAEDMDLCYKIRQAGYVNYYIPEATAIHYGGMSSAKSPSDFTSITMRESIWRFMIKKRGTMYGAAYRASILISALCRIMLLIILFPFQLLLNDGKKSRASFKKWKAILAWSLYFKNTPLH